MLFSQRCSGCHTLSYAGTHGSAPNVRTAQSNSGPNFNMRCERPVDRVLYAIENGGFSGAYMPQNIVVGQDAVDGGQVRRHLRRALGAQGDRHPPVPEQADRHAAQRERPDSHHGDRGCDHGGCCHHDLERHHGRRGSGEEVARSKSKKHKKSAHS